MLDNNYSGTFSWRYLSRRALLAWCLRSAVPAWFTHCTWPATWSCHLSLCTWCTGLGACPYARMLGPCISLKRGRAVEVLASLQRVFIQLRSMVTVCSFHFIHHPNAFFILKTDHGAHCVISSCTVVNRPAGHILQASDPILSEYVLAGHWVHLLEPWSLANLPRGQALHLWDELSLL